jgi:threonine dehydrogenase-like Zn-dependent dehydrogenase
MAVGEGVVAGAPGDRVFTMHGHVSHHVYSFSEARFMLPVPKELDDGETAAACMAMIAFASLQVADLQLDDWVAVLGLGTIGNLAAQLFRLSGARVIGIDPVESRCERARAVGIEHVLNGSPEEVAQAVRELTGGGVRIAVDAVGDSRVVQQAVALAADFGDVVLLGTPRAPVEADLTELLGHVHRRWVTIKGAQEFRIPIKPVPEMRNSVQGNLETAFSLMQQGRLRVAPLISHRLPAEQIEKAYRGLLEDKETYTGVVLLWAKR